MSRYNSISATSSRYRAQAMESYRSPSSELNPDIQNSKSKARTQRLENSGRIKLDKVSISEEAKNINHSPPRESVAQIYNRLEQYKY